MSENEEKKEAAEELHVPAAEDMSATEADGADMSWLEHLEELRWRIIYSLLAVAAGSCLAYFFIDEIMAVLTAPAGKLYYMQPTEAFFTYIKISMFAGLLLASPFVFYEIWRFIVPALTLQERMFLTVLVPVSAVLFFAGIAFAFFFALPAGIHFFLNFGSDNLTPLLSVGKYLDFVIAFLLPFGLIFEVPLIVIFLARAGLVTSAWLWKKQRLVIFLSFVIGAAISPTPDALSQTMMAVPMILLYEISLLIVRFLMRK